METVPGGKQEGQGKAVGDVQGGDMLVSVLFSSLFVTATDPRISMEIKTSCLGADVAFLLPTHSPILSSCSLSPGHPSKRGMIPQFRRGLPFNHCLMGATERG